MRFYPPQLLGREIARVGHFGEIFLAQFNSDFYHSDYLLKRLVSKHNYHRRERCALLALIEVQAPANEADFPGLVVDELVKIIRVCPGRNEHNHEGVRFPGFLVALANPCGNLSPVWWIAEHFCPPPNPGKAHLPRW